MASNLREWVVDRFGWRPIHRRFLDRPVPQDPWYYGDGATLLLLLVVQFITGPFLALSYSASADAAYESVVYITEYQVLGSFVRALHYWSAGLMVVMLVFHLLRQILVGGYKFPREVTWLFGVALFFGVLVMSFTGYVLRWDERAIYALRVALHMFSRVPFIGENLVLLVQGGPELSTLTLTRIYAVHVAVIPLFLLLCTAYHLYLVAVKGTTSPKERRQPIHSEEEQERVYIESSNSEEEGEIFYPHTTARITGLATVVFLLVVVLAIFAGPAELSPEANLTERSFPVEEWWFSWYSALIALLPHRIAPGFVVVFPVLLFLGLVLLPFLDRGPHRGFRKRPFVTALVALSAVALVALTSLRMRSPWTGWPDATPPPVPEGFVLTEGVEQGRLLFARYGCNSCHAIAGHGPRVGTDLAKMEKALSRAELRNYILHPPDDVPMPSFAGRVSEEDLRRIVDYVLVMQTYPLKD